MNVLISATLDFERALGGPQVQLSQARRHPTQECNPSLGWNTRKSELRDGGRERADTTIMDDYDVGDEGRHSQARVKGQKSTSVTSPLPGNAAVEVGLVVNAYLVIF